MSQEDRGVISHVDLLLSIEKLTGEVTATRELMAVHMAAVTEVQKDHEGRLRLAERQIHVWRGVSSFLVLAVGALGAVGAWASSILPK